jgi:hypothetical protein
MLVSFVHCWLFVLGRGGGSKTYRGGDDNAVARLHAHLGAVLGGQLVGGGGCEVQARGAAEAGALERVAE